MKLVAFLLLFITQVGISQNIDSIKVVILNIAAESVIQTTPEGKSEYMVLKPLIDIFDTPGFVDIIQNNKGFNLDDYLNVFIGDVELPKRLWDAAARLKCKLLNKCTEQ